MGEAVSLILFSVAVVFYTCSQAVMHGRIKDNPKGKYAIPLQPGIGLYYRIFDLTFKERFPLSATLLVSLTDKYHKFQLGFKVFLCATIVCYQPLFGWRDALLYFTTFGLVFTITYRLT